MFYEDMVLMDDVIANLINVLSLGIYQDIQNILHPHSSPASTALAWAIVVARFVFMALAVYAVVRKFAPNLTIPAIIASVVLATVVTQPWHVAEGISNRIGGFEEAMSCTDLVDYNPSLLKFPVIRDIISFIGDALEKAEQGFNSIKNSTVISIPLPSISGNSLSLKPVTVEWLYYLIVFVIVLLTILVLKNVSRAVMVVAVLVEVALLMGVALNVVALIVVILLLFVLTYYLVRHRWFVLAIYPFTIAMLLTLDMLKIPENTLLMLLVALMYLSLIPVFYAVGLTMAGVGEVIEHREKLGMKIKPKKVIEEAAGEWDARVVAVILTGIFMIAVMLYGANIFAVLTFLGMTAMVFR